MIRQNKLRFVLMAAVTVFAWIFAIRITGSVLSFHRPAISAVKPESENAFSASFAIVNKALLIPEYKASHYNPTFETPFKTVSESRAQTNPTSVKTRVLPAPRPRLSLQGVLFKSSPLSILANESGATFILGVGDSISGQKIVSITKTTVTLKDKFGTYELSVKE